MNEIAMFVGYVVISYFGLLAVLYLLFLPLLALMQKLEAVALEPPLFVLVGFIKMIGTPIVLLARIIPTFN